MRRIGRHGSRVRGSALTLFALCASAASGASPPCLPTVGSWTPLSAPLHTVAGDSRIRDSSNAPVLLRGVNTSGMEWGAGTAWANNTCSSAYSCWAADNPGDYLHVRNWGFNVVRLAISWANLEISAPTLLAVSPGCAYPMGIVCHAWNAPYVSALQNEVQSFTTNGVAVILDMHQWNWSPLFTVVKPDGTTVHGNGMPPWLYASQPGITQAQAKQRFFQYDTPAIFPGYGPQEGLSDAWTYVAGLFAGNPLVIAADLLNEPSGAYVDLQPLYQKLGTAARAGNTNLLLMVEDAPNASGNPVSPPSLANVVYSAHTYCAYWQQPSATGVPSCSAQIQTHLARAAAWGTPIWIGEFGQFGMGDTTLGWMQEMEWMMTASTQLGVNWTFWSYQRDGHAIVDGTGSVNCDLVHLLEEGLVSIPGAASGFYTLPPCRVIDTRNAAGPLGGPSLAPGPVRTFPIAGNCGVPAGARSIAANVTTVNSAAAGDLRILPSDHPFPSGTTVAFPAAAARANNAALQLAADGSIAVACEIPAGTTDLILDVVGYFR